MNAAEQEALSKLLTHSHIIDHQLRLSEANTATFKTHQSSKLIVQVGALEDITKLVQFASRQKLTVYTISQGKNWGFGSKVPAQDCDILLDLSLMNKILSYDKDFGTIRIEPGVTFFQLTQFLKENGNVYFLNNIGGDPHASVLGNILERGDGVGPYCERSEYACAPEVILSSGEVINIGFSNVKQSQNAQLCKNGIGPGFQELFFQSNFGIVTKLTLWLCRVPQHFRTFSFSVGEEHSLSTLLDKLKTLYTKRILTSPVTFWNDYKQVSSSMAYPWQLKNNHTPLDRKTIKRISNNYNAWSIFGGIYVDHQRIGKLIQQQVIRCLKGNINKCSFISTLSNRKITLLKVLNRLLRLCKFNCDDLIHTWEQNPLLGASTNRGVKSLVWRKKNSALKVTNPNKQLCGVLWNAFILPFNGKLIAEALSNIEQILFDYRFEPIISFIVINDRYVRVFQQLIFDRENKEEDQRALACHEKVFDYLETSGYSHARLDILSMANKTDMILDRTLHTLIKQALDPEKVLSPKRYFA
ncbi:MAG: FAD-dependent oxidoreductase [Pseudomonadales bacterium]